jgi:hypothetical protein
LVGRLFGSPQKHNIRLETGDTNHARGNEDPYSDDVNRNIMLDLDRRKRARLQLLEQVGDNDSQYEESRSAPRGFVCPLTMEVMFDPVLDAEGNTYERSALVKWLTNNPTSPVSRQPLNERMVVSNNALRETIHEFMGTTWVQFTKAEQEIEPSGSGPAPSRFRSKIDCFLRNTCNELGGLDLKLNSDGCCSFRYDNITIVLDVPDQVGIFCMYTKDLLQDTSFDEDELYKRAMELNFLQGMIKNSTTSRYRWRIVAHQITTHI